MTETEAMRKWCPFFRQTSDLTTNRNDDRGWEGEDGNCIASDCMAWRWKSGQKRGSVGTESFGYCGLAGKP